MTPPAPTVLPADPAPSPRRHDLDALRAVAMLLGIFLHASLAYVPGIPWPVQDTRPAPWLGLLFLAIHGFRMPLFFLVSGFFTAMLWKRRGPGAMLAQRYKRVFVPLVLGYCTLLPLFGWVTAHTPGAAAASGKPASPAGTASPLSEAIRANDAAGIATAIAAGADANGFDAEFRTPLITLAALVGNVDVTRVLLDAGADPEARGDDGRTPLHAAAFAGRLPIVQLLLDAGADPTKRGPDGGSPLDSTKADAGTTAYIAGLLRIELAPPETLRTDRATIRAILASRTGESADVPASPPAGLLTRARDAYRDWLTSPRFIVSSPLEPSPQSLLTGMTLGYLWFLWFLCWLAVGFAAVAALATRLCLPALPGWLVTSPAALLWTVPLTLLPQAFMGMFAPGFGPDTSAGLLPQPHVLAYYAVFFGYGAALFLTEESAGNDVESVGRRWRLLFPVALLVCIPLGLATMASPAASALPQVLYAWLMSFAAIGFFRWLVPAESRTWRYLSDSAYWLYLAHMPLVILLQQYSRDWPWSGTLKFLLVTTLATAILLATYQVLVRHTWLGLLLNGPRPRQDRASRSASRVSS